MVEVIALTCGGAKAEARQVLAIMERRALAGARAVKASERRLPANYERYGPGFSRQFFLNMLDWKWHGTWANERVARWAKRLEFSCWRERHGGDIRVSISHWPIARDRLCIALGLDPTPPVHEAYIDLNFRAADRDSEIIVPLPPLIAALGEVMTTPRILADGETVNDDCCVFPVYPDELAVALDQLDQSVVLVDGRWLEGERQIVVSLHAHHREGCIGDMGSRPPRPSIEDGELHFELFDLSCGWLEEDASPPECGIKLRVKLTASADYDAMPSPDFLRTVDNVAEALATAYDAVRVNDHDSM